MVVNWPLATAAVFALSMRAAPAAEVSFQKDIAPIFEQSCAKCHMGGVAMGKLRLDSLEGILKGSDSGKVVVPGHSQNSRLISRLLAQERPMMPYGGPQLAQKEIATIRQWIDAGAPGPDSTAPLAVAKAPKHWSYVKPVRPPLPQVKDAAW